jgi:serine/threonine protein kinase
MAEGLTLAGRYRLVTKLGQGGMGSVWRAEHLTLGIPVAIKLIDPAIAQSEEALARFRREAQAAAELRSAHVVHIIDYGVENDKPYIAMELLEGESLAARLERVGRLPPVETATLLSQVARALTRAHQQNIIHRDLKPENIFIVPEGDDEVVKVLDFGIAKKLGLSSTSSGVKTHTGAMLGTPYYMSPEQAKGHASVDHRTDIWSLGIIAYECITGLRPFEAGTLASLLIAICTEPLPTPSQVAPVPKGFDDWFAQVASRDLSVRFQSASEALSRLRVVCGLKASTQSLEITASPVATPAPVHEVPTLGRTGDPSAVTIAGAKNKGLKSIAFVAAAIVLVAVASVLLGRAFSKREAIATNASGALNPPASALALPSVSSPVANSTGAPSAAEVPIKPLPSVLLDDMNQAQVATSAATPKGNVPIANQTTAKRADPSKGKATNPVTAAPSNAKSLTGKVPPQPVRRDYDKSVGF